MKTLEYYLTRLTKLRLNAAHDYPQATLGRAPNKPVLLLAVIDLIEEQQIAGSFVEVTAELGDAFNRYWSCVMPPGRRGNFALPFFHLSKEREPFWHLIPRPGMESFLAAVRQLVSLDELTTTLLGARLDDQLYLLLTNEDSRNALRSVLIASYFDDRAREALREQLAVNSQSFVYSRELLDHARSEQAQGLAAVPGIEEPQVRSQGFRRAVLSAYSHRCAFCGVRVLTADGHTSVDGAHIKPWRVSHNDNPRNGLALCRLCHWAFDEGLIGVRSHGDIVLSPELTATHNLPGHLLALPERQIFGPEDKHLWPDTDSLRWHRHEVFRRR